ncbi:MAG: sulfite exporter TauE/SafE family protein [Deltaproteobacteria bacterium]|nr:sulfite exporter TauE/SafE family protein [Deltaproteobacteria bacterium]
MIENLVANIETYLQTSVLLAFLVVYLGGVFVSFTPCVYPVIPLTVAYVGGRCGGSRSKGFLLSLVYVLGMSVTYTAIGGFAALTGRLFGQIQTNPWINIIVANVVILLGLSMLDVFEIPMPQFLSRIQPKEQRKGYIGSFLVGLTSGFILGPCSAPVLYILLGYVAAKQNFLYGMSLLFVFALGMGTLLILLGTFAGLLASLPRAGPWMVRVKHLFGWLLLVIGEYLLVTAGSLMT